MVRIGAALTAAIVIGCGGGAAGDRGDGGGGGDREAVALDDWATAFEQSQCAWAVACGAELNQASCEAALLLAEDPRTRHLIAAVQRGSVIYDPELAAACNHRFYDIGCSRMEGLYGRPEACHRMFTGTVAAGGTCRIPEECALGTTCVYADPQCECCPGTCMQQDVPLGGDCSFYPCVEGAFCQGTTCVTQLRAGSPCADSLECRSPAEVCYDGVCRRPPDEGEACTPMDGLVAPCRRIDNWCNPTTSRCARTGLGMTCRRFTDCPPYATCLSGVCVAGADLGAPCGVPGCGPGLSCQADVCRAPEPPQDFCPALSM